MFCKLSRFSCAYAAYHPLWSMNHRNSCGQHSHRLTHRSRSRFCFCDAECQNACSTNRLCSCDFHNRLWNIRRCGRMPFGYAGWKKNCSMIRSSCYGWRIRNPNRRSSGNRLRAGADWTNTAPTSHSYSCVRLHRLFRILSDRKRRSTNGSRCWYRWQPAHSEESMYGCRSPGRYRNRNHQHRDFWSYMFLNIGRNDSYCIHYSWHDHETNVRLQRMCPGTNTFRTKGSCR